MWSPTCALVWGTALAGTGHRRQTLRDGSDDMSNGPTGKPRSQRGVDPNKLQATRRERHMKAIIDGSVVADAPESDLISIEGNFYFPPSSISAGVLSDSPTPYTCPWKGVAQYHDISAGGSSHHD